VTDDDEGDASELDAEDEIVGEVVVELNLEVEVEDVENDVDLGVCGADVVDDDGDVYVSGYDSAGWALKESSIDSTLIV